MQIFSAGRTNGTNQPKVLQEVLADLKNNIMIVSVKYHKYLKMILCQISAYSVKI